MVLLQLAKKLWSIFKLVRCMWMESTSWFVDC